MLTNPDRFLPNTHSAIQNRTALISLSRGTVEPEDAAQIVAEMLAEELGANQPEAVPSVARENPLRRLGRLLKEIPVVVAVLRIIELLRNWLQFGQL